MNHINCNETLFQIEDLMLNVCFDRYHWRDAIVELEKIRETAIRIYDAELEYSPLIQGYFDLMSISHLSDSHQPDSDRVNPCRSPLQSRTAFQHFCDGLMDEQDHFVLRHKRQRKRNYTAVKNYVEDLVDRGCEFRLSPIGFMNPNQTTHGIHNFNATLTKLQSRILAGESYFKDIMDYSWVLEQDREEGLICHFFMIYNDSDDSDNHEYTDFIFQILDDDYEKSDYEYIPPANHSDDDNAQGASESNIIQYKKKPSKYEIFINSISSLSNHGVKDQYLRAKIKGMRYVG